MKALGKIGGKEAELALESLVEWLDGAQREGTFRQERLDKLEQATNQSVEKARRGSLPTGGR